MKFSEKFIAFIDVLGFKKLVEASEAGTGMSLPELLDLVRKLGSNDDRRKYESAGPICCPQSSYLQRNLDFRVTQVSDCAVVSAEISPAGVINLIHHCSTAVLLLLEKGVMCRGYVTRGSIYHTDADVMGSGYHQAYSNEKSVSVFKREADERGTPFVQVSHEVSEYIERCGDSCVKEMFARSVKSDGPAVALFPFQSLSHSFLLSVFNAKREWEENNRVRDLLNRLKAGVMTHVDASNIDALRKAEHYIRAIEGQLVVCNEVEGFIDALALPITVM
jgi:hypothetical protein